MATLNNRLRVSRVQHVGNSLGVTIPAEFCRKLGYTSGQLLRLDLLDNGVMIRGLDEQGPIRKRARDSRGPGKFLRTK